MSAYLGDFASGSTINFKFATVNTSGAPTTFAGSTAISCFKDVSTTSLLSTTNSAITLSVDFINVTGMHHVRITTASDLSFFSSSSDFQVVVAGGTVGDTSIAGYVPAHFSIENRSGLRPTTAGRTLDVSSGGEAGLDWANVGSPTTTLNLSGTTISGITNQVVVGSYASGQTPLQPTVAGRTLDVSAGGEGGVDWANVGSPTTGLDLSATTISGITNQVRVGSYISGQAPLQPTTAGRTLDVTATGTAGVDWANVEGQTTDVVLTATTISGISNTVRVGSNADKTGYSVASGGIGSGAHAAAELNAIADGVLDRNMTTGTDSGTDSTVVRTMRQALRVLRNKVTRSGDTVTVRKEDDTTTSWTGAIASAVANALTEVDPT